MLISIIHQTEIFKLRYWNCHLLVWFSRYKLNKIYNIAKLPIFDYNWSIKNLIDGAINLLLTLKYELDSDLDIVVSL